MYTTYIRRPRGERGLAPEQVVAKAFSYRIQSYSDVAATCLPHLHITAHIGHESWPVAITCRLAQPHQCVSGKASTLLGTSESGKKKPLGEPWQSWAPSLPKSDCALSTTGARPRSAGGGPCQSSAASAKGSRAWLFKLRPSHLQASLLSADCLGAQPDVSLPQETALQATPPAVPA